MVLYDIQVNDFILSYDNVYLRPKYSELKSRDDADTSVEFLGKRFKLPVIPSNMQDVINWKLASDLVLNGYFYIMHRFDNANLKMPEAVKEIDCFRSISVGVNQNSKDELIKFQESNTNIEFITIDTAHGHHVKTKEMISWIKKTFTKKTKIIAGNVATSDGYKFLCDLGVDAVKCGIGGGSICSTKFQTGFHLPTLQSVYECSNLGLNIPIIADGGAKYYGDIAKALTLGATMVMSGGWFASCIDSPAKIVSGKKVYRGSTSYEAKGNNRHVEGRTLELEEGLTYQQRMEEIKQALQSSISYAGGEDLTAFNFVEFERILPYY